MLFFLERLRCERKNRNNPINPKKQLIKIQPTLGPNGHLEVFGAVHPPRPLNKAIYRVGSRIQMTIRAQASIGSILSTLRAPLASQSHKE